MRRGTFFFGGMLVVLGILFLLDNLKLLGNVDLWSILGPIFLIALGLWFLLGILIKPTVKSEHVDFPLQGVGSSSIVIKHGAGRLKISAGASAENLLEGDFSGGLEPHEKWQGDQLSLTLAMPTQFISWNWGQGGFDWNVKLNAQVPLDLEVNSGAVESRLDLSGLDIKHFVLKTGASSNEIILPSREGVTHVRIEAGVAAVNIHVPQDVAARIRTEAGLAGVTIDRSRFPMQGGFRMSPDFEIAARKIEMKVVTGLGSVDIH